MAIKLRRFSDNSSIDPQLKPATKDELMNSNGRGFVYRKEWYDDNGELDSYQVFEITKLGKMPFPYEKRTGISYKLVEADGESVKATQLRGLELDDINDNGICKGSSDKFIHYITKSTNDSSSISDKDQFNYVVIATTPSGGVMKGDPDATFAHAIKYDVISDIYTGVNDDLKSKVIQYIIENPNDFSSDDFELDTSKGRINNAKFLYKVCKDDNYGPIKKELIDKLLGK